MPNLGWQKVENRKQKAESSHVSYSRQLVIKALNGHWHVPVPDQYADRQRFPNFSKFSFKSSIAITRNTYCNMTNLILQKSYVSILFYFPMSDIVKLDFLTYFDRLKIVSLPRTFRYIRTAKVIYILCYVKTLLQLYNFFFIYKLVNNNANNLPHILGKYKNLYL